MTAAHSVLVAGHLCIDITPELTDVPELVPGQLYEIGSAQLTLGGCVANTSLALAAAGTDPRLREARQRSAGRDRPSLARRTRNRTWRT